MGRVTEGMALMAAALLGGMETVYGAWAWRRKEEAFHKVWRYKLLYGSALLWLVFLGAAWLPLAAAGAGGLKFLPQAGYLPAARLMALILTYLLLAVIDAGRRVIPDRILICYFFGQLVMGAACQQAAVWGRCLPAGSSMGPLPAGGRSICRTDPDIRLVLGREARFG